MGKHVKLRASAPASNGKPARQAPHRADDAPPVEAEALVRRTLTHCDQLLTAVENELASGTANSSTIRESASLARAISGLSAELRAREKAAHAREQAEREAVTLESILEFARAQSPSERKRLSLALAALEETVNRSGLA